MRRALLVSVALAVSAPLALFPARAQKVEQGVAIVSEQIASRVDGFSYKPQSSSDLEFRGTALAPRISGTTRVKTTSERSEIAARFEHLPAPSSLGPLATYVLWIITPEGRAQNVGALALEIDKARIETTTPLSSFALILTAEPHFAVSIPSKYIVAQSVGVSVQGGPLVVTSLAARADYDSLKPLAIDPKDPQASDLVMAHYAVSIAESVGAPKLADRSYGRAREALTQAEQAHAAKRAADRTRVPELSREAIQVAEDARAAAVTRQSNADLEALRAQISDRDAKLKDAGAQDTRAHQELSALQAQLRTVESRLPSAGSRQELASQLLSRWLVLDPAAEGSLTAYISSDEGFVKGRTDLSPSTRERLAVAAGILLGIGNVSVVVTPALQLSEDVRQLGLSQQRARTLMDWLASLGLNATAGVPPPATGAAEKALAPGPGVELVISFEHAAGPTSTPAAAAAATPSG
jgi:outer membrane protein OmpA-like peptidoglycan-associated protein